MTINPVGKIIFLRFELNVVIPTDVITSVSCMTCLLDQWPKLGVNVGLWLFQNQVDYIEKCSRILSNGRAILNFKLDKSFLTLLIFPGTYNSPTEETLLTDSPVFKSTVLLLNWHYKVYIDQNRWLPLMNKLFHPQGKLEIQTQM